MQIVTKTQCGRRGRANYYINTVREEGASTSDGLDVVERLTATDGRVSRDMVVMGRKRLNAWW